MDSGYHDCKFVSVILPKESVRLYIYLHSSSHAITLEPTRISPRNIQMIRDKAFYGFKSDNLKMTKKPIPWVDVSDEEDRGKQNSMKRKANGHSHHYAQNGHKHKKHRLNNEVDQTNGIINSAGPSQMKHMQNGAVGHISQDHAKVKAIQEQRMQLPIAKGIVRLLHKTIDMVLFFF